MSTMQEKLSATRIGVPMGAPPARGIAPRHWLAAPAAAWTAQLAGTLMLLAALTGLAGFRRDGVTLVLAAWLAAAPQFLWTAFLVQGLCVLPRDGWENPV